MSLEASEIVVAGTGHLWRAPIGTAFPTNITAVVSETLWTELGYAKTDGVTFKFDRDVKEIEGWQSREILRVVTMKTPRSIAVELLQLNQNTWNLAMGGGTWTEPTANNYLYEPPAADFEDVFQYIVEFSDGTKVYRFCYRRVQNMSAFEFMAQRDDPVALPVEVRVLAADGGLAPWFLQTNDVNLGEFVDAGS